MPVNNFKLFDEKKANMMSDDDYAINQQRLNGVQSGVASSQLQNKTLYQTALMCYALAQLMAANGYDANDANAVSTFVNNLSLSMVQKVVDKASANDVSNKVVGKWVDSSILGQNIESLAETYLKIAGGTMTGDLILNGDPTQSFQASTKKYVDETNAIDIIIPATKLTAKKPSFDLSNFDLSKYKIIRIFGGVDPRYDCSSIPPKVSFNNTLYFSFHQNGVPGFLSFYIDIYVSHDGKACNAFGYTSLNAGGQIPNSKYNVNFSNIKSMQLDFGDVSFNTSRDYSYVEMIGIKK